MIAKIKTTKLTFIIFSGLVIFSFAFFTLAQESSSTNKNIFQDSDQDGLSDQEEKSYGTDPFQADTDGDGYTDGAEVKSGYDPTKPAPGDKIVNDNLQPKENIPQTEATSNLTEKVSGEVANLFSQKEGENSQVSLDDLDSIVQKSTEASLTFDDLPEIDDKAIKIKKQNFSGLSKDKKAEKEKKDEQEYLISVSYILISNSPEKISDKKDLDKLSEDIISKVSMLSGNISDISYFENLAEKGQKILDQMKEVEVPESLVDIHKKGLKLATFAVSLKDKAKPDENDPIGTITKLSKVQSLMSLSVDFSQEIAAKFIGVEVSDLPIGL
jgi:hypothetical protein